MADTGADRGPTIMWFIGPAMVLMCVSFAFAYLALTDMVAAAPTLGLLIAASITMVGGAGLLSRGAYRDGEMWVAKVSAEAFKEAAGRLKDLEDHISGLGASDQLQNPTVPSDTASHLAEERLRRQDLQRTLADWQDRVVEVARSLERLACDDELDKQYHEVAERLVTDLERKLAPLGFRVIRPVEGDEYDELVHEPVEVQDNNELAGKVVRCLSWGFITGDRCECARVTVGRAQNE